MPKLFVLSGPDVGSSHSFAGDVDLGRAPGVAIVLRAPSVSRRHAQIVCVDGRWFLEDLGSANGTSIGNQRIEREELSDGSCFELGELELRFRLDAVEAPEPSASTTVIEARELPVVDRPAQEADELELEGDWDDSVPAPVAPRTPRSPAAKKPKPAPARTAAAKQRASIEATQVRSASQGTRGTAAGGRVLQYQDVQDRKGFLYSDLAQYPLWVRGAVLLLALAFFAGLAYGAFRLTTMLRSGSGAEVSQPAED